MANQNIARRQQIDSVRGALEKLKPQLALALPEHLTPERLLRVTMTAIQNTPKLLDCDRTSLFAAILTSAQLGLEPDGVLGQAYLVPYGGRVQFIPGYKGYLALARNSGEISTVQAHEVCANDFFEYAFGINEKLEHRPADGERGEVKYFYAYALYKDGGHIFEVMSTADVNKIRDGSDGYKAFKAGKIRSNPWDSSYVQMGRKTAIRRLANYLPLNVQRAAALDAAQDRGSHASIDQYGEVVIDSSAEEVVAATEQTGATGATSKLDQLAGGASGNGAPAPAAATDEPAADDKPPADKPPNMTQLKKAIKEATSMDKVDELLDLSGHLSADHKAKVLAVADARKEELADGVQGRAPETSNIPDGGDSLFGDD